MNAEWTETVYFKTGKAHEELNTRRHGLRAKARQLLVLLDGERPLGALNILMAASELQELVQELAASGFIAHGTTQMPVASQPIQITNEQIVVPSPAEVPLDPVKLTRAKAYLIETSQQHLGLMAAKLQREIAEADDNASLRAAFAHWNMALRESHSGAAIAGESLQKAQELIGWTV